MQEVLNNRERVSALVDGQLRGEEFVRAVEWTEHDTDGQLTWEVYHVLGEVLRTGDARVSARDVDFMAKLKLRLQLEPPALQNPDAIEMTMVKSMNTPAGAEKIINFEAANDDRYRWKRLAGLASVIAVMAVGFVAFGLWGDQRDAPQLAQVEIQAEKPSTAASALADQAVPLMIRDRELDAILAAHRQFGGTTALQGPAGFLRNATFEGGGR